MTRRRGVVWVLLGLVSVVFGAAASLAVAWTFMGEQSKPVVAWRGDDSGWIAWPRQGPPLTNIRVQRQDFRGATAFSVIAGERPADAHPVPDAADPEKFVPGWIREMLFPWGKPREGVSWPGSFEQDRVFIGTYGWPMEATVDCLALRATWRQKPTVSAPIPIRMPLSLLRVQRGVHGDTFIYWPGLAVDALVYGAACFGLLSAARWAYGATAGRRRRGQGLCPKCAYDLRGLSPGARCPECGWGKASEKGSPPLTGTMIHASVSDAPGAGGVA